MVECFSNSILGSAPPFVPNAKDMYKRLLKKAAALKPTHSSPLGSSLLGSCLSPLSWCSWQGPCGAPGSLWRANPARLSSRSECQGEADGVGYTRQKIRHLRTAFHDYTYTPVHIMNANNGFSDLIIMYLCTCMYSRRYIGMMTEN